MVDSESLLRFWWSLQGGPSGEEIERLGENPESGRVAPKAKSRETTTMKSACDCHSYHSLSHWSELAFSLGERSRSENRTAESKCQCI